MPLPDWYSPGDPHSAQRMRQLTAIAAHEQAVRAAADAAIAAFLRLARAGVLGEATPETLTAAAGDVPPDLSGGWPTFEQWAAILRQYLLDPIAVVFGDQFYAEARRAAISATPYVSAHMERVFDRLVIWPVDAFNDVRAELQEGLTEGDDVARLRDRIGRVLSADAPSRKLQAEINALTRTIEDDDTSPQVRREARARRAALYRRKDDADRLWQWKAARIARTETLMAFNAGTYMGAAAYELATGETRYKQWWSTSDNRVRSSHWAAHMQVQELHGHFSVGGFLMDHPGDPTAPGHETINCRCTLLILTAAQADAERARYERERPGRTNLAGQLIDDDGQPVGPAPVERGFTPHPLTADAAHPNGDDEMTRPVLAATDPAADTDQPTGLPVGFRGRLTLLDEMSGDGRFIGAPSGEPRVRPLPLSFKWQDASTFGHDNAVTVGALTRVWVDGNALWGSGPLDLADPEASEFARKLGEGYAGLVSVDLDDCTAEYRVMDPDGKLVDPDDVEALLVPHPADPEWLVLPDGYREVEVMTDWRLMSTTGVADPAFPDARVFPVYDAAELTPLADLIAERQAEAHAGASQADVALVADGAPLAAPIAWFERPEFDGPTPMTITDDGRVYGHAAVFESQHIGFSDRCVYAPRGADYSRFHIKAYRTADGGDIAVGPLVMGADHASTSPSTSVAAAMAHYADNGRCAAYVRAGEDQFGVWVAGVLDPGLSEIEQVRVRAMTLSGDWRQVDGRVAFIAALAVNVPGFAVPRKTVGERGELVALVAAGALYQTPERRVFKRAQQAMPTPREYARAVLAEMREQERAEQATAALAVRVHAGPVAALAARVHAPSPAAVAALTARVRRGQ